MKYLQVYFVVIMVVLAACQKSKDEDPSITLNSVENQLVGKWKLTYKSDTLLRGTDLESVTKYEDFDQDYYFEFSSEPIPDNGMNRDFKAAFDGGAGLFPVIMEPGSYQGKSLWKYNANDKQLTIGSYSFELNYIGEKELIIKYREAQNDLIITWNFSKAE